VSDTPPRRTDLGLVPYCHDCNVRHEDGQHVCKRCGLQNCRCANLNEPQPPPVHNDQPAVWDLVMTDMRQRDAMGEAKYGVRLQPHNGRDFLIDAYQEMLDHVCYLRGLIYERDGK